LPTRRGVRLGLETPDLLLDLRQFEFTFARCCCGEILLKARRTRWPLDHQCRTAE
jgi:hypothetical protein